MNQKDLFVIIFLGFSDKFIVKISEALYSDLNVRIGCSRDFFRNLSIVFLETKGPFVIHFSILLLFLFNLTFGKSCYSSFFINGVLITEIIGMKKKLYSLNQKVIFMSKLPFP